MDWKEFLIRLGILLLIIAGSLMLARWWFNLVIGSNLPDWFKFYLLVG